MVAVTRKVLMGVCAASVEAAHQDQTADADTGTVEMTTTVLEQDPLSTATMTSIIARKEGIDAVTTGHAAEIEAMVGIVVVVTTVIVVAVVDAVSVVVAIPVVPHKAASQLSQLMTSATGEPFSCSNLLPVSDLVS